MRQETEQPGDVAAAKPDMGPRQAERDEASLQRPRDRVYSSIARFQLYEALTGFSCVRRQPTL